MSLVFAQRKHLLLLGRLNAQVRARRVSRQKACFFSQTTMMQRLDSIVSASCESNRKADESLRTRKIPTIRGTDVMRNPKLSKSTAFTLQERQILGIHGLLPPAVNTQELQMQRFMAELRDKDKHPLQQYIQLTALQSRNERLFYRILMEHVEELMPIVYTPTVGLVCQKFGMIFREPRGLFICIHDRGHVRDIVANWPEQSVKAVVMTDGERILGLGDLGCNGMGIPIGKLSLYTACAGIHPSACLPIMIDTGTDNEKLLEDPMYIGLRQKRCRTQEYDDLIDELIVALQDRYGENVLIQFEDFGNKNAFRLLDYYKDKICTFNDDIQGTAAVCVAGILASLKVSGMKLADHTFLFQGAGEAAIGIAELLVLALEEGGMANAEARKKIWLMDSKGLVVKDRACGGLTSHKKLFAHSHADVSNLEDAVSSLKPTAIIGVAATAGAFSQSVCEKMAAVNERPLIFALSNPTSRAECTAEQAYTWTEGKCLFASGSPFGDVTLADGRVFSPGQGNNVYIFPGLALGVICCSARRIPDALFLVASQALAELVTDQDASRGLLYPPLRSISSVSCAVAKRVMEYCYEHGHATLVPRPSSLDDVICRNLYNPKYLSYIPDTYDYPAGHYMPSK